MKNLTIQFVKTFVSSEEFQRRLVAYDRAMKTEEWKFWRDVILTIKGTMANDMFSKSHTHLTQEEKDVIQKTYFHINEILDFLLQPRQWVEQKHKSLLTNLMSKVKKPSSKEGDEKWQTKK